MFLAICIGCTTVYEKVCQYLVNPCMTTEIEINTDKIS